MTPRVLIGGIGNIFLGDDGFGVEVASRLVRRGVPEGLRIADFGIRSLDLAYALMDGYELNILVDAMPRGGKPGTVYVLEVAAQSRETSVGASFDPHTMDPVAVLELVNILGGQCGRLFIVGCEPSTTDERIGLSAPVMPAVDEAIVAIDSLLANFLTDGTSNSLVRLPSTNVHSGDRT